MFIKKWVVKTVKNQWCRVNALALGVMCWVYSTLTFAQGAIPTPPSSDQIGSNADDLDVWFNLFKTKVGPILVYGSAIFLIYKAISTLIHGIDKAREQDDWSKMKTAVIYAAVMLTMGISLAYIGYTIFTNMQEGAA